MSEQEAIPKRIWVARHLIANGELAESFNVPPELRGACIEYARPSAEPVSEALAKLRKRWPSLFPIKERRDSEDGSYVVITLLKQTGEGLHCEVRRIDGDTLTEALATALNSRE